MTKPKTQPTKPSAGAYRAAYQILTRQHLPGWNADLFARIIDRETGVAELLEAAKRAAVALRVLTDSPKVGIRRCLEQAIAKCERSE